MAKLAYIPQKNSPIDTNQKGTQRKKTVWPVSVKMINDRLKNTSRPISSSCLIKACKSPGGKLIDAIFQRSLSLVPAAWRLYAPITPLQRIIFRFLQLAVKSIHEKPFPFLKWACVKVKLLMKVSTRIFHCQPLFYQFTIQLGSWRSQFYRIRSTFPNWFWRD